MGNTDRDECVTYSHLIYSHPTRVLPMKATVLISALIVTLAAPFASAYSIVDTQLITGTVEKVDVQNNLLVINKNFGKPEAVQLPANANIELQGKTTSLSALEAGDKVRVARTTLTPTTKEISGEIVRLNRSDNSASIRTDAGKLVKVKFGNKLRVHGIVESNSIDSLRKGHLVSFGSTK